MFIEIPPKVLFGIATDSSRMPKLYYHPRWIARKFFWLRLRYIHALMRRHLINRNSCLDFGCGSGVFLPTLSNLFRSVRGIDLEMVEARNIAEYYALKNVHLISADIFSAVLDERFDAIVAADVLEHFDSLDRPVAQIKLWLKGDGLLFTSLPTENYFTMVTRRFGKYTKPADHYYSGEEVETALRNHGFIKIKSITLASCFPLYLIGVWRQNAAATAEKA